jgi:hypothetical protein
MICGMLLKKSVSKISKAAKFSEGLSWSQQLADKVEPDSYPHKLVCP